MEFKGIMARAKNNCIGRNGSLPWGFDYPGDMAHFKAKTTNQNVLMGNATYKGMGSKPLKARNMFILTKENKYGFLQLFSKCGQYSTNIVTDINALPDGVFWVCGGKATYEMLIDKINEFWVTTLTADFDGDCFNTIDFDAKFKNKEVFEQKEQYIIERYWN